MALPTFDNSSTGTNTGNTNFNVSHTATGSNLCIIVGIANGSGASGVSSVTYAGLPLTLLTSINNTDSGANVITYVYYRANVPAGTANINIVKTGAPSDTAVAARTYTNVNKSNPVGTPVTGTQNNGTTPSLTVSNPAATTDSLVIDVVGTLNTPTTTTEGSGQTKRAEILSATMSCFTSEENSTGSVVMDWTLGTSRWSSSVGFPLFGSTPDPNVHNEFRFVRVGDGMSRNEGAT